MLATVTLPTAATPVTESAAGTSSSASSNKDATTVPSDAQGGNFSTLLQKSQNNSQNVPPPNTPPSRQNAPSDTSKIAGDKAGSNKTVNSPTSSTSATDVATGNSVVPVTNQNVTDADLIAALQQNLQALVALTQNNAKTTASDTTSSGSGTASGTTATQDSKSKNDAAIAAILVQLNIIYGQLVNNSATATTQVPQTNAKAVATTLQALQTGTINTVHNILPVNAITSANANANANGNATSDAAAQTLADLLADFAQNADNSTPSVPEVAGNLDNATTTTNVSNTASDTKLAALAGKLLADIQQANDTLTPDMLKTFLKEAQAKVAPVATTSPVTTPALAPTSTPADALPKAQVDQTALVTPGIFAQNDKSGSGDTNSDGSQSDGKDNNADKNNANTIGNSTIQTSLLQQPTNMDTSFGKLVASANTQAFTSPADQVSVQIKNAAATGASQITVQLNPDNLGKVDVQLVTDSQGKVNITISSDSRNTLALLQNDAKSLQNALQDIGMKTNNNGLSFNLRDGQQQQGRNAQNQGKFTKVDAVGEVDGSSSGTLIARYSNSEYIQNYQLSLQKGVDIRI